MNIKQYHGDIWNLYEHGWYVADPTNAFVKRNGANVMGRGISRQVLEKFKGIDHWYGQQLLTIVRPEIAAGGEVSLDDIADRPVVVDDAQRLVFVPVKTHWRQQANRPLMARSLEHLRELLEENEDMRLALPRLGCGNGGDEWEGPDGVKEQLFRPFLTALSDSARERVAIVHPPAGISD